MALCDIGVSLYLQDKSENVYKSTIGFNGIVIAIYINRNK